MMSKTSKYSYNKRLHSVKDTTTLCNNQKELIYVKIKKPITLDWKCNKIL